MYTMLTFFLPSAIIYGVSYNKPKYIIILGGFDMCKEISISNLVIGVSIGNINQALTTLRTYGLSEKEATELLAHESETAISDYGTIPQIAITPDLIEPFGIQFTPEIITFAYNYMDTFKISWEILKDVFSILLDCYTPEEIGVYPEKVRYFLEELKSSASTFQIDECGPYSLGENDNPYHEYWERAILKVKDAEKSEIKNMCQEPQDKWIYDDQNEDESFN